MLALKSNKGCYITLDLVKILKVLPYIFKYVSRYTNTDTKLLTLLD